MKNISLGPEAVGAWLERLAGWALIAAAALLVWRRNTFTGFVAYEPAVKPSDVLILLSSVLLLAAFALSPAVRRAGGAAARFAGAWARYPALLAGWFALASLWAAAVGAKPLGLEDMLQFGRFGLGMLAFALALFFSFRDRAYRSALFFSFFSSLLLAPFLFAPREKLLEWFLVVSPVSFTFLGFQNGTSFHASLLLIPIIFAFAGMLVRRLWSRGWWAFAIASTLLFALLFWTGSRAGWFGAGVGMLAAVFVGLRKKGVRGAFAGMAMFAGVLVAAFLVLPRLAQNTTLSRVFPAPLELPASWARLQFISPLEYIALSQGETSFGFREGRFAVWRRYASHILESPVGFGPAYPSVWHEVNSAGQGVNGHSVLFELLLGGGLGALVTFVLMAGNIARSAVLRAIRSPGLLSLGTFGALVGVLVNAAFLDALGLRWIWFVFALAAAEGEDPT